MRNEQRRVRSECQCPSSYVDGEWSRARAGGAPGDPLPGRRHPGRDGRRGRRRGHRGRDRRRPPSLRHRPLARARPPASAGDLLHRVADLLERDKAEVARLESLDTGKRLVESEYDVDDVVSRVPPLRPRSPPRTPAGWSTPATPDVVSRIVHEPIGVCGLITPVELPAAADLLEGRALPRGGQHLRAQAERADAAHRHPPDAPARRGRPAGRGRQPRARRRAGSRAHRSPRTPGRRPGVVHRRPRDRRRIMATPRAPSRRSRSSSAARTPTSSSPTPTSRWPSTSR